MYYWGVTPMVTVRRAAEVAFATFAPIRTFVSHVDDNEPGTLRYTSVQSTSDATRFLHFFIFEDEAAERKHATSDNVKEFTDVLYPLVDGDAVVFTDYWLVAST